MDVIDGTVVILKRTSWVLTPRQSGRLIQGLGHLLKGGQEQHHGGTELPYFQHTDGDYCHIRGSQPFDRADVDQTQKTVDETIIHKQYLPQDCHCNRAAEQGRYVVYGSYKVDSFQVPVQNHSNNKGQHHLARHCDEGILQCNCH